MNIPQDTFNKLVTTTLLLYTMIMFTLAWYTGKPINLNDFFILIAPLVTHTIHLVSNGMEARNATAITVQKIQSNGKTTQEV